jgi:L-asparaginase II
VAVTAGTVEVWRGDIVESRHAVHVAVVDAAGKLVAQAGDTTQVTYARSAVKPLQALPLVEDGVLDRFGFGTAELALACASHSGEAEHVVVARRMLAGAGVPEEALACGAHAPFHRPSAQALRAAGAAPARVHNNCSGKHAGMLALAQAHGWPLHGYHEASHPVQQRMLGELARWCDVAASSIGVGVDGCGVATFAVPLRALAGAFARFAGEAEAGGTAARRVLDAMAAEPHLVAGTGRLCTALLEATGGRVSAKVGAEGVYGALVRGEKLGVALKVADGAKRAAEPSLIAVLRELDLLSTEEAAAVHAFAEPAVLNTRGEAVGRLRAVPALRRGG